MIDWNEVFKKILPPPIPKIRAVEHYGTIDPNFNRTYNEHWVVNGKTFYHQPTHEEVEEAYARHY